MPYSVDAARRAGRAGRRTTSGRARSRTCWWRGGRGSRPRAAEDPVRVRAGQVRVRVDHLRLDPQPELACRGARTWSTSGCSPSGQTSSSTYQSPRPAVSSRRPRNQPSSSTNRSTPTSAARSASAGQPVEVVVEVDRLPGVEHHRPRRAGWPGASGCSGAGERSARRAPRRTTLRRATASRTTPPAPAPPRRARRAQHRRPSDSRSAHHGVTAPADVHAPHLAVPEPEPLGAGDQQRGASCPVRPCRVSRSQAPWWNGRRWGCRSRPSGR